MMNTATIENAILDLRNQLQKHQLYSNLNDLDDVRVFMENHVFAVWDFMSLLKALQRDLTCVEVPWIPKNSPIVSRFINELVLGEESDLNELGEPKSHFQIYLEAMEQAGANTDKIHKFLHALRNPTAINEALKELDIDPRVIEFVEYTFSVIHTKKAHLIASAFTFGREDIIPDMFIGILNEADSDNKLYSKFRYYLERHIEVDGGEHGPIAMLMISELCGQDPVKWEEAISVAKISLEKRIKLWEAINDQIRSKQIQYN
jgi:hypothetical protein